MICFVLFHRSFHCSMVAATLTCLNSTDVPKLLDHCDQTFTLYKFRPFGPILDIRCDFKKSVQIPTKILFNKKLFKLWRFSHKLRYLIKMWQSFNQIGQSFMKKNFLPKWLLKFMMLFCPQTYIKVSELLVEPF